MIKHIGMAASNHGGGAQYQSGSGKTAASMWRSGGNSSGAT